MFFILGAIGLILGSMTALIAQRFPSHQARIEQWGGHLFVGSLALLGFSFPIT